MPASTASPCSNRLFLPMYRSGTLQTGGHALCSSKGSRERIGRMMEMHSNDRQVRWCQGLVGLRFQAVAA